MPLSTTLLLHFLNHHLQSYHFTTRNTTENVFFELATIFHRNDVPPTFLNDLQETHRLSQTISIIKNQSRVDHVITLYLS